MRRASQLRSQLALLLLFILSIAQCGGEKSLSREVEFKSRDNNPVVVKGKLTIGEIEITPPWFRWQYSFKNDSTKRVMVATVIFKISTRKNGVKVEGEAILDPGTFCDVTPRTLLAIVEPYDPLGTLDEFSGSGCTIENPASRFTPPLYESTYITELPASDTGVYTIEAEAVGWFEDPNTGAILERYQDFDYLITQ